MGLKTKRIVSFIKRLVGKIEGKTNVLILCLTRTPPAFEQEPCRWVSLNLIPTWGVTRHATRAGMSERPRLLGRRRQQEIEVVTRQTEPEGRPKTLD
jgi:hypothetical protein